MKQLAVLVLFLVFLLGCTIPDSGKGVLQGKISIGPLCPVERVPPLPGCEAGEETYNAYPLVLYKVGSGDPGPLIKQFDFHADKDGNYRLELDPGVYQVRRDSNFFSINKTTGIKSGETTTLDIDIDTGIR